VAKQHHVQCTSSILPMGRPGAGLVYWGSLDGDHLILLPMAQEKNISTEVKGRDIILR
jgi:hypothetical protein